METIKKNIPKLRFPEFGGVWLEGKIKEFVKVNQGLAILKSNRFSKGAENRLNYITIPYLEGKIEEYIENPQRSVICKKDDIIITRTGSGIGQIWTNNYGVFHNNFFKISPIKDDLNKKFLFFYLITSNVQNLIKKYAGVGAIPDLNHSDFYIIPFYKPTLPEQHKIATFLTTVDSKIEQLTQKKQLLEQYKRGVMQQIFSQKLRFKDENGNSYSGWVEKELGEIGITINGLTGKTKENFGIGKPYVQYKQIFNSSKIDTSKCDYVEILENDKQTKVKFGDVFFTTSSETPNEIGTASVLLDDVKEMYLNSFCFGYRANENTLDPSFAQFLFRSEGFRRKMIPLAQGSTRYNISKSSFMKLIISLPIIEEQTQIANFLSAIDSKIELVSSQLENTQEFKKGLLQQMFV